MTDFSVGGATGHPRPEASRWIHFAGLWHEQITIRQGEESETPGEAGRPLASGSCESPGAAAKEHENKTHLIGGGGGAISVRFKPPGYW